MLALAADGAAEGSWLTADRQTGGRGRQGRAWDSPPGNFHGSTLVRVRRADPPPATLALVAAVALHEVVAALLAAAQPAMRPMHELEAGPARSPRALLKWPNDLLVDGAKLSGILLERSGDAVVIGIGVNLIQSPAGLERAVTSLAASGIAVTPPDFLDALAAALDRRIAAWRGGLGPIIAAWLAAAHPVGTPLTVNLPGGDRLHGTFAGLTTDGALRLREADGEVRQVHAGDVFLV